MRRAFRSLFVVVGLGSILMNMVAVFPAFPGMAQARAGAASSAGAVASVSPAADAVVGVGMPVTIHFAGPVADRQVAQQSVAFFGPQVPDGAFSWLDESTLRWTPKGYWPAHSTITVAAGGMKHKFKTGSEVLGIASISAHTFTVKIDGVTQRVMPASMGKPKHPTPIGSFTALEKQSPVVMDSRTIGIPLNDPEGYKLTVYYAVRVTWGGVYVHSAPWSTGAQGNSNVSHGCINLSPDNASWYYNMVSIGDPVVVQA